jgi:hypothetical protein
MVSIEDRFNTLATSLFVPSDILIVDKGCPFEMICIKMVEECTRVAVILTLGIDAVARILLPSSITPAFYLPGIYLINQGLVHYTLYLRRESDPPFLGYYELQRRD